MTVEVLLEPTSFDQLKHCHKRAFVLSHYGFFDRVLARLQAAGIRTTKATISRTWNGKVSTKRRDPDIVAALEAEYLARPSRRTKRVA